MLSVRLIRLSRQEQGVLLLHVNLVLLRVENLHRRSKGVQQFCEILVLAVTVDSDFLEILGNITDGDGSLSARSNLSAGVVIIFPK